MTTTSLPLPLPLQPPTTISPAPAVISLRSNESLNLSVLRRHNLQITAILSIAPYAVIYTFNVSLQTWEKSGTEGTLFVCRLASSSSSSSFSQAQNQSLNNNTNNRERERATTPPAAEIERYAVIVLNRRGLENFTLELTTEDDVELTPEYVILQGEEKKKKRNKKDEDQDEDGDGDEDEEDDRTVYGLWIFAEPAPGSTAMMRETNAGVIQECARRAEASRCNAAAAAARAAEQKEEQEQEAAEAQRYRFEAYGGNPKHQESSPYWNYEGPSMAPTTQQHFTGGLNGGDLLGDLFRRARQGYGSNV